MRATPVVNHLLRIGFREKVDDLTPLKVQKMLFFLHGWYLAIVGDALIDGGFEKWPYGPVSRDVYDSLKQYGSQPVSDYLYDWDPVKQDVTAFFVNVEAMPRFEAVLETVWKKYSPLTGAQLSTLTHMPNTPWSLTAARDVIKNDLIHEHFVGLAFETRARIQHES